MKVILIENIENIGRRGEIKEVANGLARNHLLPKKMAVEATPGNVKVWEKKLKSIKEKDAKILEDARELGEKLDSVSMEIPVKAGEEGKIFGSVTSQHIADKLNEQGYEISKKDVLLEDPIKTLGTHSVDIRLHPEVKVDITVNVVSEKEQTE